MNRRVLKSKLNKNITKLLRRNGFNVNEINATIRSWEYASLSEKYGHSYNRVTWLLKMVQQNKIVPNSPIKITKRGTFNHIEGNNALGYLVAEKAIGLIIDTADQYGIGLATISGCYPTGCMGQYTEYITKSGHIGIVVSHSAPRVTAYGTLNRVFGTMGHSFGFPSKRIPYIYDASVGMLTNGAIMHHYLTNTTLPKDSVFTEKGSITVDPREVVNKHGLFTGVIAISGGKQSHKMSGVGR